MDKIYVFGHKKPDTDSITSAISLSYLKNKLGYNTVPMVLGDINNETKYALEYFNVDTPNYLNDVKLQIKDLNYNKNSFISKTASIYETYNYMNQHAISNVPVIDNDLQFIGTVSMKDIAKELILCENRRLDASYNSIISTLNGKEIVKIDDTITGNLLVASYKSTRIIDNVKLGNEDILIVGDRHSIIEYAINSSVKLIVLTGNSNIKDEHLELAKKNGVNIIQTELDTYKVANNIILSNDILKVTNTEAIITFEENDDVQDFIDVANKTKYSNFPVLDKENKCLGSIKLADVADKKKKKVILVDHNEYEQSADGLDEAEIIEIVDHHKIGSIGTSTPINFRNMPVGSTNTILYMLFKENNVEIPSDIAGLMMSGIISDTLLFASPTTTDIDKYTVEELAKIANVDYKEYGMNMFKAGSALNGKSLEEILFMDFKNFTVNGEKVGVGQVSTVSSIDITNRKEEIVKLLDETAKNNDYKILGLFVTDILTNGSYIYYNNNCFEILNNCFGEDLTQGKFLAGVVSRKKQVIPAIMDYYE